MNSTKKHYRYMMFMGRYNVYSPDGHKIGEFHKREDAIKEVYRLNGWMMRNG